MIMVWKGGLLPNSECTEGGRAHVSDSIVHNTCPKSWAVSEPS